MPKVNLPAPSQTSINETRSSDLFKSLCLLLKTNSPENVVLTALVYGIELGRKRRSFPLPTVTEDDWRSVMKESIDDGKFMESGLKDITEYLPWMGGHFLAGCLVQGPEITSMVAGQLVFLFRVMQYASERREIENLEYLVRDR